MKPRLVLVLRVLSVSLMLLFAVVAVNHSSGTASVSPILKADGIPLPPPPPPQGGGNKVLGNQATSEDGLQMLVAFGGDGIPLPPPPPPQGGGGKFLES